MATTPTAENDRAAIGDHTTYDATPTPVTWETLSGALPPTALSHKTYKKCIQQAGVFYANRCAGLVVRCEHLDGKPTLPALSIYVHHVEMLDRRYWQPVMIFNSHDDTTPAVNALIDTYTLQTIRFRRAYVVRTQKSSIAFIECVVCPVEEMPPQFAADVPLLARQEKKLMAAASKEIATLLDHFEERVGMTVQRFLERKTTKRTQTGGDAAGCA